MTADSDNAAAQPLGLQRLILAIGMFMPLFRLNIFVSRIDTIIITGVATNLRRRAVNQ